ncbi:MAG: histidine ammonia-lyase, partial [Myxococcota bacterium]|nr:histidine ammonia-lyase [Myxococcota bacterium]
MSAPPPLALNGHTLTLDQVVEVARGGRELVLDEQARARMATSRAWVARACKGSRPVYGINTGFGSLARVRIPPEHSATLSMNLIRSHAAGVGPELPADVVRAMMLLRANALAKGVSGCRPRLVEVVLQMLNADVVPVVPSQGSCGSSGDLAPLSHLGLVLTEGDHGEARLAGERMSAESAMAGAGIERMELEAKEGLAITNGAQLTTALTALAVFDAQRLVLIAEIAAAMSVEALLGASRAFAAPVHRLRPYAGAIATAANLRRLLDGSSLVDSVPGKVQDAYSLRCTPQVLGAVRDTITHVSSQVSVELNAATDNPVILVDEPGEDKAYSAGLFHGEPVGIAADILKIAVSELASLSERRLYRLTTGSLSARLPPALAHRDRPELGLALPQTTAAALVSENKSLCWPSSVDSIPTCEDQEDHVAMSTTAARGAVRIVENARRVVAIELLGAASALAFRREESPEARLGIGTHAALEQVENVLATLDQGATPSEQIAALVDLTRGEVLTSVVPGLNRVGERGSP